MLKLFAARCEAPEYPSRFPAQALYQSGLCNSLSRERVRPDRGTVDNPMTREEVVQKCRDLVEPVLGKANCTTLIDKVLGLESVKDIRELRSVLQKA